MAVALDPVLLTIGGVPLRWLGVFWLAGSAVAIMLWLRTVSREHLSLGVAAELLSWVVPGALLGALAAVGFVMIRARRRGAAGQGSVGA